MNPLATDTKNQFGATVSSDTRDAEELEEWCEALDSVLSTWGPQQGRARAVVILDALLDHGARRMLEEQIDEFYYVTVTNENVDNPSLPAAAHAGVLRGLYLLRQGAAQQHRVQQHRVQLFGSGAIMGEVLRAATILEDEHGIAADVWSVTSYIELAREGLVQERLWRQGERESVDSWFETMLTATEGPIIAATDYVRALPEMVRAFIPPGRRYITLGTDGFGRSDSRAALRAHFEVDAQTIVQASLRAMDQSGKSGEIAT